MLQSLITRSRLSGSAEKQREMILQRFVSGMMALDIEINATNFVGPQEREERRGQTTASHNSNQLPEQLCPLCHSFEKPFCLFMYRIPGCISSQGVEIGLYEDRKVLTAKGWHQNAPSFARAARLTLSRGRNPPGKPRPISINSAFRIRKRGGNANEHCLPKQEPLPIS